MDSTSLPSLKSDCFLSSHSYSTTSQSATSKSSKSIPLSDLDHVSLSFRPYLPASSAVPNTFFSLAQYDQYGYIVWSSYQSNSFSFLPLSSVYGCEIKETSIDSSKSPSFSLLVHFVKTTTFSDQWYKHALMQSSSYNQQSELISPRSVVHSVLQPQNTCKNSTPNSVHNNCTHNDTYDKSTLFPFSYIKFQTLLHLSKLLQFDVTRTFFSRAFSNHQQDQQTPPSTSDLRDNNQNSFLTTPRLEKFNFIFESYDDAFKWKCFILSALLAPSQQLASAMSTTTIMFPHATQENHNGIQYSQRLNTSLIPKRKILMVLNPASSKNGEFVYKKFVKPMLDISSDFIHVEVLGDIIFSIF